ncbi:DNA-binding Lrp family transcriptional regulator [Desulfobaculum xiamenense]|uniref:siroheme decarboxylase n=1 Tax=Desulfobaculum xiamenense TaxID=995050 RepID=A0A846QP23_9BACT|nr:Lrp/AsnC family transcriptional regulator [Desulfobaculum xiamenense]NJB68222.1 DNA-binding Lrp family transcriptional regulator [Desulfobaculum xiamenense]
MAARTFTDMQRTILRRIQGTLPDSPTPFADIAAEAGVTEQEVLDLVRGLKADGAIRRFGATLRHQKAGYAHNAMVAWYVEADLDIDEVGAIMAARPEVSHCYHRRNCMDWPYNIYTMIHGQNPDDYKLVVEEIIAATGVTQYDVLESVKELKKSSMKYF